MKIDKIKDFLNLGLKVIKIKIFKIDHTIDHGNGILEKHLINGSKIWYKNGEYHRENEPAAECLDGTKFWYISGELHRENGPAVEFENGEKHWYINGKKHREDGPALERSNGEKYWYIDGEELSEQEFNAFKLQKELSCNDIKTRKLKI